MVVKALLGVRTNDVHTSVKYSVCSKTTNRQITRTNNFFPEITSFVHIICTSHAPIPKIAFQTDNIKNKIFFEINGKFKVCAMCIMYVVTIN